MRPHVNTPHPLPALPLSDTHTPLFTRVALTQTGTICRQCRQQGEHRASSEPPCQRFRLPRYSRLPSASPSALCKCPVALTSPPRLAPPSLVLWRLDPQQSRPPGDLVLVTCSSVSCLRGWPLGFLHWFSRASARVDLGRGCGCVAAFSIVFRDLSRVRVFPPLLDLNLNKVPRDSSRCPRE